MTKNSFSCIATTMLFAMLLVSCLGLPDSDCDYDSDETGYYEDNYSEYQEGDEYGTQQQFYPQDQQLPSQAIAQQSVDNTCPICGGSGRCGYTKAVLSCERDQYCNGSGRCGVCNGRGRITNSYNGDEMKCTYCNGSGSCGRCGGSGRCHACGGRGTY